MTSFQPRAYGPLLSATMHGQAEAQYRLKMIYGYGQVVEQDYAIAIELFTSVAN